MICMKKKLWKKQWWYAHSCITSGLAGVSLSTLPLFNFFYLKTNFKINQVCDGNIINLLWQTDRFIAARHRVGRVIFSHNLKLCYFSLTPSDLVTVQDNGGFWANVVLVKDKENPSLGLGDHALVLLLSHSFKWVIPNHSLQRLYGKNRRT